MYDNTCKKAIMEHNNNKIELIKLMINIIIEQSKANVYT